MSNKLKILILVFSSVLLVSLLVFFVVKPNNESKTIILKCSDMTMKVNETSTIEINTNLDDKLIWTSSNPSIVSVDNNGNVVAYSPGKVVVLVKTEKGNRTTCTVTVNDIDSTFTPTPYITITPTITPYETSTPTPKVTIKPTITPTPTSKPTSTPNNRVLTKEEQICESVKNNNSIDYKSFASLKKNDNDYYAMKAAHDCANKYNKPVVVTKGVYNVYKKKNEMISVQTNTNLNGSTIYIHNEVSSTYNNDDKYYVYHIELNSKCTKKTIEKYNSLSSVVPSTGNYFVTIREKDGDEVWHRLIDGEMTEIKTKKDSYIVTNGKTNDPSFWNYKGSKVSVEVCPIPSNYLVFENANIKTIILEKMNNSGEKLLTRGFLITRSNTIINNVKHNFINSNKQIVHSIEYNTNQGMFYRIQYASNVTLSNCVVTSLYRHLPNNSSRQTSYDISAENVVNFTLDRVTMFNDGNYNELSSTKDWGVMVTNEIKNFVITNSKLNRIDAHRGVYNLTVKNTIVGAWGIFITGSGITNDNKLVLEDVTWKYTNTLIYPRGEYGATWNGSVSIKNCTVSNTTSTNVLQLSNSNTIVVFGTGNWDNNSRVKYGHPIYNPTKVTIDGLNIQSSPITRVLVMFGTNSTHKRYYLSTVKNPLNKETKFSIKNVVINGKNVNPSIYSG